MPAPPVLAEALLVILRWLHAMAAILFLGWSAVLWLDGPPAGESGHASRRFKEIVELTLIVFLATGAVLSFDRLSRGAGGPYAAVLALSHDAAPGHDFNISDGLDITWKEFTDDLAKGLGCSQVRWILPYWLANGLGFSLEHSYRLLRRATRLTTPPLLSRQAVQVLGKDQDFSNRKARELLGWEPRIDYAAGLDATLVWLKAEQLSF